MNLSLIFVFSFLGHLLAWPFIHKHSYDKCHVYASLSGPGLSVTHAPLKAC